MISNDENTLYALTAVKDPVDAQWKLKYGTYSKNSHHYEWYFIYHDNAFAIKWCGDGNASGEDIVLYVDSDELKLMSYTPSKPLLPTHFISNFHSIYS